MVAIGTKPTYRDVCYLSAFGGKADLAQAMMLKRPFASRQAGGSLASRQTPDEIVPQCGVFAAGSAREAV